MSRRESLGSPIVVFVASPAALGGSNVSLLTLLDALGPQVYRVVAAPRGAFSRAIEERGLADEFIELPPRGNAPVYGRLRQSIRLHRGMARLPRKADVIHANATSGVRIAALAGLISRTPILCWVHDMAGSRRRALTAPLFRLALRRVRWAAVSEAARDVVVHSGLCRPDAVSLIPNPIDPRAVVAPSWRRKGRCTACFIGTSSHRKGFDLVPGVVGLLAHRDLHWLVVSNRRQDAWANEVWAEIDRFSEDLVQVEEFQRDVRDIYGRCDVLFMPSRQESFGRVAAEAMLNGIPVVASDIPALAAQIGDNEAGLLFRTGEVKAAADAIARLVDDPNLRESLGRAGRRRAMAYEPGAISDRLLKVYLDLANSVAR